MPAAAHINKLTHTARRALGAAAAALCLLTGCAAAPVSASAPAQTDVATVAPVAAPTEDRSANASFLEHEGFSLPSTLENLQYGDRFHLLGTVETGTPMVEVAAVLEGKGLRFEASVAFNEANRVTTYELGDGEATLGGFSLDDVAPFEKLPVGEYTFTLLARLASGQTAVAAESKFSVEQGEWKQLISNNLAGNYPIALEFFGERERFLYKYKEDEGRSVTADPVWEKEYITNMTGANGERWRTHKDAVPFLKDALLYLQNTRVRVYGTNGDSGIITLESLVRDYNGCYNSRFITDSTFVSHHAFGTAIDLNANIAPNEDKLANKEVIAREVRDHLSYDGISADETGAQYYCFSYNGSWSKQINGVPSSVVNYLLYELAFFRAGFGWGYYFSSTSDAMHFTLTEMDPSAHDGGLRKIFDYIS